MAELHDAINSGDTARVQKAIRSAGILGLNATNEHGYTPLFIAARNGNAEILKELLSHRSIRVNRPATHNGQTPLHVAVLERQAACVMMLLDKGASPLLKDRYGKTPLDYSPDEDSSPSGAFKRLWDMADRDLDAKPLSKPVLATASIAAAVAAWCLFAAMAYLVWLVIAHFFPARADTAKTWTIILLAVLAVCMFAYAVYSYVVIAKQLRGQRSVAKTPSVTQGSSAALDLRSPADIEAMRRAAAPLDALDEGLAVQLCTKLRAMRDPRADASAKRALAAWIKQCGHDINRRGGNGLMLTIHTRVVNLDGDGRLLERAWAGIGIWGL